MMSKWNIFTCKLIIPGFNRSFLVNMRNYTNRSPKILLKSLRILTGQVLSISFLCSKSDPSIMFLKQFQMESLQLATCKGSAQLLLCTYSWEWRRRLLTGHSSTCSSGLAFIRSSVRTCMPHSSSTTSCLTTCSTVLHGCMATLSSWGSH